jgi:PAS domain S-box-containing protein
MSKNKKRIFEEYRDTIRNKNEKIEQLKKQIASLNRLVESSYSMTLNLVNSCNALIYLKDLQGNYLFVNKAFVKYVKKTESEILGHCDFQLFDEKIAQQIVKNDNEVKFLKCSKDFEENFKSEEAKSSFLSMKSPLYDSEGNVTGVSGVSVDISGRVRILESIFEREELLRTIFESAIDPIFVKDTGLMYKKLNFAMEKFCGKGRAFILGKTDSGLFEGELVNHLTEGDVSVLGGSKHETVFSREMSNCTKYFHLIKTPLQDNRGNINGICGVIRDITQTKEAELQSSALANVIEQIGECVVITDLEGNIEYTNPAFKEITGYEVEEVLGKNPNILQSGEHSKSFYKELWDTITSGKVWKGVFHNKKKDGTLYYENATIFPIKNSEGEILKYAAVKMDLTFLDIIDSLRTKIK